MNRRGAWKTLEHRHLKPWFRRASGFARPLLVLQRWRTIDFAGVTVHYQRHLDGGGRTFGQDYVPLLRSRGMPKQKRCFEWCAGPGFIGFSLLAHDLCESLCLADINPQAVRACHRTVAANGLGNRVSVYRSDNLDNIPASEQWDLIVGNPPHFADAYAGELRCHDRDWNIHKHFFAGVAAYLSANAVIVLQENNRGSTAETFRAMIEAAGLMIVFVDDCVPERTHADRFYYIGIMRRGDTPPAWASSHLR